MIELSSGANAGGGERTRRRRVTRRPGRREQAENKPVPPSGDVPNGKQTRANGKSHPGYSGGAQSGVAADLSAVESQRGQRRKGKHKPQRKDAGVGHGDLNVRSGKGRSTSSQSAKPNHNSRLYAALDLGTNNCRLLIAVPRPQGRFRVIDGFSRIVRLGEGLSQSGRLSEAAMSRAVEALAVCASKLESRDIRRMRLIATEACRQAGNGDKFLARVKAETGLELEVVNRETEARLAAQGCGTLIDRKCEAAIMFDIGGGSTELAIVRGKKAGKQRIAERISAWTSLPLGVVTVAEQFGGKDVSPELFEEMKLFVLDAIGDFAKAYEARKSNDFHLLGTSGTVTTMAGLHLGLQRYERRLVDGIWLSSSQLTEVTNRLLEMDYQARRSNPCIGEERADLVLAGCAILEAIRETWPAERLRVADRGLREGLLTEMMEQDQVWRSRKHNKPRKSAGAKGK